MNKLLLLNNKNYFIIFKNKKTRFFYLTFDQNRYIF